MPGGFNLKISDVIEYNKKPGKPSTVKTIRDPNVPRDDFYKSGTIHTGPGEPANSVSKRTPKLKQVAGKPITSGKLLRPGGPGGGPSKLSSRAASSRANISQPSVSQSRPVPSQPRPVPQPGVSQSQSQSQSVPQPLAALNGMSHTCNDSASSAIRAPPPPPPAAPPVIKKDTYKVLYDFVGQTANEMSVNKDDLLEIIQKENNGLFRSAWLMKTPLTQIRMVAGQKA